MYVQVDLCAQRPKEDIDYPLSLSAYFFEARSLPEPGAPIFSPKLEVNKPHGPSVTTCLGAGILSRFPLVLILTLYHKILLSTHNGNNKETLQNSYKLPSQPMKELNFPLMYFQKKTTLSLKLLF